MRLAGGDDPLLQRRHRAAETVTDRSQINQDKVTITPRTEQPADQRIQD